MATRALPSELEIQREVEALRDLRRRSITQGALAIDLDLPLNQPLPSAAQSFWSTKPNQDADSSASSHEGASLPRRRSSRSDGSREDNPSAAIDDPSHLFWVPASLHPEIAPAEFRAFLKEHARAPPSSDEPGMSRSNSLSPLSSSSTLSRRKSMLSRQYQPSENDDVDGEGAASLRRNRSHHYANQGPQLTINDLQKLEQLAEEASKSDDPTKFRHIVRRSLSFNISPSALSHMEEMPDLADEADVPIIVPPPGQILRRAARTKIRKPSLAGDGGGHRFKATRRVPAKAATAPLEPRTSSEKSSSDHGESIESAPFEHISAILDELPQQRPESYSEETFIIDAYARDEDEELQPQTTSPESATIELPDPIVSAPIPSVPPQLSLPDVDSALFEGLKTALLSQAQPPQPPEARRLELVEPANVPLPISPPRIVDSPVAQAEPASNPFQPPQSPQHSPRSPQVPTSVETGVQLPTQRKEKDKRSGLFGKWGGDKSSKKAQKNIPSPSEKETGFFSSLFGGSKKKQEVEPITSPTGRETAQALLGAPKSKLLSPNGAGPQPGSPNNYSRYPIHVERAIYRLSHIKLANPRRPLYEQVLISNLMFWYLGIINKAQMPAQQPNGQPTGVVAGGQSAASVAQPGDNEREQKEKAEKERLEREQREREAESKKKETGKRGPLTKTPVGGPPGGGRRAEMPIKGPQYEMQHRVMEREYVNYAGQGPQGASLGRANSAPAPAVNNNARGGTPNSPPNIAQPQPQSAIPNHVLQPEPQRKSPPPSSNSTSPAPPGRRSQSPPITNLQRPMTSPRYSPNSSQENLLAIPNGRTAGRSLSATAIPSPPMYMVNGRTRKGASAYAGLPPGVKRPRSNEGGRTDENAFEEEDVPLAVWQQQRKR